MHCSFLLNDGRLKKPNSLFRSVDVTFFAMVTGKQVGLKTHAVLTGKDQLFEDHLALNPGLNLTQVSLFLCSKAFSWIIFSATFRASNHQLVDKKN